MDWWAWLLIAVAALVVVALLVNVPDIARYLRIKRM